MPAAVSKVMWDLSDWGVFAVAEPYCTKVYTYVYQVQPFM